MITTTLNRIRDNSPCAEGWTKLLEGLGKTQADDEPLPFADILQINGLDDALWACGCEPHYAREWQLFAVACARRVQHLMTDERSIAALDVAERFANGKASAAELRIVRNAAVASIAPAVAYTALAPTWAAYAAARAAAATYAATRVAAAWAADAADAAAGDEGTAEREWQTAEFLRVVTDTP